MSHQQVGLWLVVGGLGLALLGLLVWAGGLAWFGKLPGDIRYQSGTTVVFVPLTSMLVVSVLLSVGLNVVSRLLGHR